MWRSEEEKNCWGGEKKVQIIVHRMCACTVGL